MDNFVKILEKAKIAEISELKKTLKKKHDTAVSEMKAEVTSLEKKLQDKQDSQKHLTEQRKKYNKIKTHGFAELKLKKQISKKIFDAIIDDLLKKSSFEKKWLESNINSINDLDKGVITASASTEKIISKLIKNHEIKINKDISKGFFFENENIEIDATRKTYFDNFFEENIKQIYKTLFS